MIDVTFAQLEGWLALFLWPFVRITSFLMAAPLFGHSSVPARVKIGLGLLLTVIAGATMPPLPDVPLLSWQALGIIVEQVIIGLALGLALHIMFTVVQLAGELIGLQMGLSFATFYTPDNGNTMILARLLYMLTLLMFLAFNGHLLVIGVLVNSFAVLPIGVSGLESSAFELLVRFAGTIFVSGLLLALPLITALLAINLGMGILNRAVPQFTVFSIGFPLTLTAGIFLLAIVMNDLGPVLERLFNEGLGFFQQLPELLG